VKKKPTVWRRCPGCGISITLAQRDAPASPDRDPKSPPEPIQDLTGEHVGDLCLFCDRVIPAEDGALIRELIKTRRHLIDDSTLTLPSGRIAPAAEINHLMYQWGAEERARMVDEAIDDHRRRKSAGRP
jgi:hypothetical protein